jgi:hypothetical protein
MSEILLRKVHIRRTERLPFVHVTKLRPLLVLAAALLLSLLMFSRPAGAVDNPDYASTPPPIASTSTPSDPSAQATGALVNSTVGTSDTSTGVAGASTSTGALAFTGADTMALVGVGAGLVVLGGLIVAVRRRSFA